MDQVDSLRVSEDELAKVCLTLSIAVIEIARFTIFTLVMPNGLSVPWQNEMLHTPAYSNLSCFSN
jgi:hypothetical protein